MLYELEDIRLDRNYTNIKKTFKEVVEPTLDELVDEHNLNGYYSHRCLRPFHFETIGNGELWGGDFFTEKNPDVFFRASSLNQNGLIIIYAYFKDDVIEPISFAYPINSIKSNDIKSFIASVLPIKVEAQLN